MQRCSCLSVCCCLHCFFAMDTFIQYFEMLYWSLIVALAKKNFTNKELKKQNKYLNLRGIQRNHDWTYRHVEWSTNPTIFSSSLGKWPQQGRVLKMLVVVGWLVGWVRGWNPLWGSSLWERSVFKITSCGSKNINMRMDNNETRRTAVLKKNTLLGKGFSLNGANDPQSPQWTGGSMSS